MVRPYAKQVARYVGCRTDLYALNALQTVAHMYASVGARTARRNVQRFHSALAVHPNYTVVGKAKTVLLVEIPKGGSTRGQCKHREDRRGQLEFEFLEHFSSRSLARQYSTGKKSTFRAVPNPAFYIQISRVIYYLQDESAARSGFRENYTMPKCIAPGAGRPGRGKRCSVALRGLR